MIPDIVTDARWPQWGPAAHRCHRTRSVLTFRLFTIKNVIGALSMYSTKPDAFSADDKAEGAALAAHIDVAVLGSEAARPVRDSVGLPHRHRSGVRDRDGAIQDRRSQILRAADATLINSEHQDARHAA